MISPGLLRTPRIWGLCCLLILLLMVPGTREAPVGADSSRDLVKNWEPVQQYLHQYGYLTPSPNGADNLRTEEKLRQAVRTMQRFGGVAPTGVVDQDTLALMRRRRCGMPDISQSDRVKRYAVQGQAWKKKDLTWSIKYLPSSMSEQQVRAELTRAFRLWSEASMLSFREVSRSSLQADIVVSFERGKHGDGYAFDGPGVVLAHAFFPGEGIGGDAHFDGDEPWVDRERPGVDGVRLFAVAAHEFGHSLGLSHSSVTGALMNPFYQPIQDNFELPYDDQNGIQNLYGSRNPNKWAPLDPYIPPRTTRAPPTRPPYRPTFRPDTRPTRYPPPRDPTTARPPRLPDDQPDVPSTCNTTFDAVSVIRKEIYFFKGKYFWRFVRGELLEGYPAETSRFFYEKDLKDIDAVYERPKDMRIVFFSGPQYWVFDAHRKMPGYPRPLTDLGLPPDLKRIDAAMVWGHNGKTYFFSGKQYWRYDETEGRVELDYPRDMSMWRGVPYGIDAAFTNSSVTYFFKGRKFWKFDNARMRVENKTRRINEFWFRCPSRSEQALDVEEEENEQPEKRERYVTSDSNLACFASNCVTAVSFAVVFLFYTARFILYL